MLGGSGYRLTAGREATVDFLADSIAFYVNSMVGAGPAAADARITYPEVVSIQIEGPGAVSRGRGFIGGGFGFEGALEGIAIATVLNALTTKTKIHTFIQILRIRLIVSIVPRRPKKKREPSAPAERRILPIELQVGDRLADETGEWESAASRTRQQAEGSSTRASTESTSPPVGRYEIGTPSSVSA